MEKDQLNSGIGQEVNHPISISTPRAADMLKIQVPKGNSSPDSIVKKPSTPDDLDDECYQISAIDLVTPSKFVTDDSSMVQNVRKGDEPGHNKENSSNTKLEKKEKPHADQILLDHLQR